MPSTVWKEYYEKTGNKPPRPLLLKALEQVHTKEKGALDIGAGTLNDTKYLLSKGWDVTAVDSSKEFMEHATHITDKKFQAVNLPIEKYQFDKTFGLINAQFVLPFIDKNIFKTTFAQIISSLKSGGVFCGQFFGPEDEWNKEGTSMTFLTKEAVEDLLKDLQIISLDELHEDAKTAAGKMKYWHVHEIIAMKK